MTDVEFLRHALATLAYRAAKTMRGAPESFANFLPGPTSSTPCKIVTHMGDLLDWSLTMVQGEPKWHALEPGAWADEVARFFDALTRFDRALAAGPNSGDLAKIFQGPIADALTHTGQLAMLRRLHGAPMKGESYTRADIVIGRTGFEQTPADPKYEFD